MENKKIVVELTKKQEKIIEEAIDVVGQITLGIMFNQNSKKDNVVLSDNAFEILINLMASCNTLKGTKVNDQSDNFTGLWDFT